jgi:hypothetical protein
MSRSEKKLIKRMKKRLDTRPNHYFLFTADPRDRVEMSGTMEGDAWLAAGLMLFAEMSDTERRVLHTLMADQMENDPDVVRTVAVQDIYLGGE